MYLLNMDTLSKMWGLHLEKIARNQLLGPRSPLLGIKNTGNPS
jgi:hypothetical protein